MTDLIYNKAVKQKNDLIDFHEFCFQFEMNQLKAKQSNNILKGDLLRIKSIKDREKLFTLNFFRDFEVIILASGHYHKDFDFAEILEKRKKIFWNIINEENREISKQRLKQILDENYTR